MHGDRAVDDVAGGTVAAATVRGDDTDCSVHDEDRVVALLRAYVLTRPSSQCANGCCPSGSGLTGI